MVRASDTTFDYRGDIDGLRAIAVLAVVIFHLGFERLEGGFLGVDVFFVVSGFLITSIIEPKIVAGTFSFKDFYLKRIRRLLPPAFATIAATFMAAAFILTPDDFVAFSKSAIAALLSVSNIYFFTESGYWDTLSELKPLLHTWSLGVEEQFYLFWPAILAVMWKLGGARWMGVLMVVGTLTGIFLSEQFIQFNDYGAFFLLPARGFEFALGAVLVYLCRTQIWAKLGTPFFKDLLCVIGLVGLVVSFLIYKGHTRFPGFNAVWPCLATACVLLAGAPSHSGKTGRLATRLLSNPVAVWFGAASYSLYLVHWPVVSLMRYKVGLELTIMHQIFAVILMLILTVCLHYGVERRLSTRRGMGHVTALNVVPLSPVKFAQQTAFLGIAMIGVATSAIVSDGWTWRFPSLQLTPSQIAEGKGHRFTHIRRACTVEAYFESPKCDQNKPIQVLTFGNSHEPDGYNFLKAGYGHDPQVQLIYFGTTNKCQIQTRAAGGFFSETETCKDRLARLFNSLFLQNIDIVFYAANAPLRPDKQLFVDMLTQMKSVNPSLKIITFGGYIITKTDCAKIINQTGFAWACVAPDNVAYYPQDIENKPLYPQFSALTDHYIDRMDVLCPRDVPASCRAEVDGIPAFYDRHHNSLEFSEMTGRLYADSHPDMLSDLVMIRAK